MSLYRLAVFNGRLIREKRKLFRWWVWSFNRSEEDHLIRMKNRLTALRQEQSMLQSAIPEEEERLKDTKDHLRDHGGVSTTARDGWSPRREPVRLKKETNLGKRKKKDKPVKEGPSPLFNITPTK